MNTAGGQNNITALFLSQSYSDNWDDYQRSLKKVHFPKWDFVILTASNENQADVYRSEIKTRIDCGLLTSSTHFAVIPDPGGKRVGSGGATFNVLRYISDYCGNAPGCFYDKRILVIHSGGDSKRVPQYSAIGKLFSPVPRELPDGRRSTLFDELIIGMSGVPLRFSSGMLTLSGDSLLLFNPIQIDWQGFGAACISFKENAVSAQHHGVFLGDGQGFVKKFLHKQPVEVLKSEGAVNSKGNVDLDTGAVFFSSNMVDDLFSLVCTDKKPDDVKFNRFVNDKVRLSFYADFLYPLAGASTLNEYYSETPEGEFSDELKECREELWNILNKYNMRLLALSPAQHIHFGTTGELMNLVVGNVDDYGFLGWKRGVKSACACIRDFSASNSYIHDSAFVGSGSYIEDSVICGTSRIGKGCIISNVLIDDVTVPDGAVLHCLEQSDGSFVCRIYGANDNPKNTLENGGSLMGTSLRDFLRLNGLNPEDLWSDDDRSLWSAKLYPACKTMKEAVLSALNIYNMSRGKGNADEFKASKRYSLCQSFNNANVIKTHQWQDMLKEKILAHDFIESIKNGVSVKELRVKYENTKLSENVASDILKISDSSDFGIRLRARYYLSKIADPKMSEFYEDSCFKLLSDETQLAYADILDAQKDIKIKKESVKISLPVRINIGGGWSDTPPYCYENGGTILTAPVKLNGRLPIISSARRLDKSIIAFESKDSGAYAEFDSVSDILNCRNPYDPFTIHKSALIALGIISKDSKKKLSDILSEIGGGIYLSTEVLGIPRGSGLGTSSIICAACIKALDKLFSLNLSLDKIYSLVLVMEQLMSTGGGWQDQVGGLSDGFEFFTSLPGIRQNINHVKLNIPPKTLTELSQRFVLIYTGQRRLARNLLREIMSKYIGGDREAACILDKIQINASEIKFELERGRLDSFIRLINEHWELQKKLDANSTNTCIEQIFTAIGDLIDAKMICGAGGGGFVYCIMKKGISKEQVNERLIDVFQDSGACVWDSEFI